MLCLGSSPGSSKTIIQETHDFCGSTQLFIHISLANCRGLIVKCFILYQLIKTNLQIPGCADAEGSTFGKQVNGFGKLFVMWPKNHGTTKSNRFLNIVNGLAKTT